MKLINNYGKPLMLEDGTTLAASGTEGAIREVKTLSERARDYIERGWINVIDEPTPPVSKKKEAS